MNLIYICSPYRGKSRKKTRKNIYKARRYCRLAAICGKIPFAPHLLFPQFLNDDIPAKRDMGIAMGKALMPACHEMWVFGTPSEGMADEIAVAREMGIGIRWFDSKGRVRQNG